MSGNTAAHGLSPRARWIVLASFAAALAAILAFVLLWRGGETMRSVDRTVKAVDPTQFADAFAAERERRIETQREAARRDIARLESQRVANEAATQAATKSEQDATEALKAAKEKTQAADKAATEEILSALQAAGTGPKTRGLSISPAQPSPPANESLADLNEARAQEARLARELADARASVAQKQAEQERIARESEAARVAAGSALPAAPSPDLIEAALAKAAQPLTVDIQIPASLEVGRTYTARVVVARGAAAAAAVERFVAETHAPVARQIATESTDELAAVATGTLLKTTPLSETWQTLRRDKAYRWEWTVEPKEAGQGALLVELRQKLFVEGRERVVNVDQFPVTVAINVTAWSRIVEAAGAAGPPLKDAEDIIKGLSAIIGAVSATWLMRHRITAIAGRLLGRRKGGDPVQPTPGSA